MPNNVTEAHRYGGPLAGTGYPTNIWNLSSRMEWAAAAGHWYHYSHDRVTPATAGRYIYVHEALAEHRLRLIQGRQ
jgi:hypothetical protein